MSITLNDSGSYTCIFSPQKLGPKESWWVWVSPQVSPEVRKWTGCTWAWKLGKPLQYRVPQVSTAFCLHDRWQKWGFCSWFSPYFMVVLVFWGFYFCFCFVCFGFPFFFLFFFLSSHLKGCDRTAARKAASAFPGCGALCQVDGRRERKRFQCLHADWETPDKAHGLLLAKEQIYSQASEVKERIHS